MNLIMSLMREVEWREKAAKKAKQEVDNCTLDINLEMDELIMAQQQVKESNDKRAKEVYAQRVELATEMKELQSCVSGVLNEGDGCVATIDEMCKALEKRLISAIIKKEAADKDKLGKELALAYQKSQMEKLVTESKRLEQEAMENLKVVIHQNNCIMTVVVVFVMIRGCLDLEAQNQYRLLKCHNTLIIILQMQSQTPPKSKLIHI
ncbi:hypothetical protein HanHA300_Chr04g0146031 [Helianthus annuus]|nr:hypothetical protein HanHA300_Chr04g0146031 [Helianthus annuus]KAJ0758482.1 hypothetical protein HanLR1_Chr04g0150941 [Helianthus annuus]KAJ0762143.1 hypothetical protein HanOQP8_Chr04g0158111 [Helianthus annuus]